MIETWSCKNCKATPGTAATQVVTTWSHIYPTTSGYLALSDVLKAIVVAFRGTAINLSVIIDLQFNLRPLKEFIPNISSDDKVKVHNGFGKAYAKSRASFYTQLRQLMNAYPDYKVYVTGHSSGAAQAALCAVDLANSFSTANKARLQVYLYGQPRTGNPEFAHYYQSLGLPTFRVVNKMDIVPVLPLVSMGYLHHKQQYWYTNVDSLDGMGIKRCDALQDDGEDMPCFGSDKPLLSHSVWDHLPTAYLTSLASMVMVDIQAESGGLAYPLQVYV
ncbi:hypothetical protein EV182_004196 [Spiromyces aspiralis]|uniref:Uncharacterized protein n=1 Tax=Spiromyces aspiralis TaxID=68401 RepID=A0ACC1HI53_9FUNG|nr:hypothetical protein EV182_004196 [Spiromyces aspiralis]